MATRIHPKQVRVGLLRQQKASGAATTYAATAGTNVQMTNPGVAASNYLVTYYDAASVVPDPAVSVESDGQTSQYGIHAEYERVYHEYIAVLPRISFSAIVDLNRLAPHLIAAMQAVSEDVNTPYSKSITFGGLTGPIDFLANGGYLHTIALDSEASADDGVLLQNAVLDSLTLSIDFDGSGLGKVARMSGVWVGTSMLVDQTLSGTWASGATSRINDASPIAFDTKTIDSVAMPFIRRFELTINNNVTALERTSGGQAQNFAMRPVITGRLLMHHDDVTEKLLGDLRAGARVQLALSHGSFGAGDAGYFTIALPYAKLISNPYQVDGDFLAMNAEFQVYAYGGATPGTIVLVDEQDWGY